MLKGLYVISDDKLTPKEKIISQMTEVLQNGVKIIQLRNKTEKKEEIIEISRQLQKLCKEHGAKFILNDEIDIAINEEFDGLHIGKSDYKRIEYIRANFSGIIGVSCYDDVNLALEMEKIGVDYVAFGSFFSSKTKPNSKVISLEVLKEAKEKLKIPICAIGGINTVNVNKIIKNEPDMIALINDIWTSKNLKLKIDFYNKTLKK